MSRALTAGFKAELPEVRKEDVKVTIADGVLWRDPQAHRHGGEGPLSGAIAALFVPTPTPALVAEMLSVLGPHNRPSSWRGDSGGEEQDGS